MAFVFDKLILYTATTYFFYFTQYNDNAKDGTIKVVPKAQSNE